MKYVAQVKVYGEYGVGASTQYVYANTKAKILAVDTSQEWINVVMQGKQDDERIHIQWTNVGPLGEWGRPLNYARRDTFSQYVESIWHAPEKPELVLVDGRFRVSCFLYSLAHAPLNTIIIFDDYKERPHYHVVEEFLMPIARCGRQAIFRVSDSIDRAKALTESRRFCCVIE